MTDVAGRIADNLAVVRERIAAAATRADRTADSVTLVAVTKHVPLDLIRILVALGCHDLGESRPQELWSKAGEPLGAEVRWHLIGHLQRNKIARTLPLLSLVHSVDSARLLAALDAAAAEAGRSIDVLLEVNISTEASKTGLPPTAVAPLVEQCAQLPHLQVRGLMGMASLGSGEAAARREFARLRALRERLQSDFGIALSELSMGMSGDYEVAIEEGATIVRVGSALMEGIGL